MADDPRATLTTELERTLLDLGQNLSYPSAPHLADAVSSHLAQHPAPRRSMPKLLPRRIWLYPLLAALAVLASVLALSPGARSGVASWFHITGVRIEFGHPAPHALGHSLHLGQPVSLREAQAQVSFRILVPTLTALVKPDAIYVGRAPVAGSVSLVYRARRGLPRASTTGVGLLITEFRRRYWDAKVLSPRTSIRPVTVNGVDGVWLAGEPHDLYYVAAPGELRLDTGRLAGNALIWQADGLALRLEGRISAGRAVAIAESMRPYRPK